MADFDIDPFSEHESRPEEPTDENISLTQVGGGSTWDYRGVPFPAVPWKLEHEQETSFGGRSWKLLNMKPLLKVCIKGYLEATMNPLEQSIFIISTSEMDSYTIRTMSIP